ncbi:MAG: hypothetical protein E7215_01970 [Clostridium sulfidigenes]|jgi:hypothetical protein|uniref:Uncharacterized protein n=1 Tax=Clostridium sulfidigenes TaxID=318464 RepID=A0A927ZHU1_9CLOT|nr:hypothetical protein [Clostridium sulfidigenes]
MKKVIRTIALLICTLIVTSAPTNAYAATRPTCTVNLPHFVVYDYIDELLVLQKGDSQILTHYEGEDELRGAYFVPAKKECTLTVGCWTSTPYIVEVYMFEPAFATVYRQVVPANETTFTIPANSYDRTFIMNIKNVGSDSLTLYEYTYQYQ